MAIVALVTMLKPGISLQTSTEKEDLVGKAFAQVCNVNKFVYDLFYIIPTDPSVEEIIDLIKKHGCYGLMRGVTNDELDAFLKDASDIKRKK